MAYIHFKNAIYEIDGLRNGPILIEENVKNEEWIKKVKPSILNRINLYAQNEIKFNLLALVPDRLEKAQKLDADLKKRRNYVQNLIEKKGETSNDKDLEEYNKMTIKDEEFKVKKFREENERRQFNYIPFIYELMQTLAEKGKLSDMYKEACDEIEAKEKAKEQQKENEKEKK